MCTTTCLKQQQRNEPLAHIGERAQAQLWQGVVVAAWSKEGEDLEEGEVLAHFSGPSPNTH